MTTPQRGFKAVARQLIHEKPGLTAEEYARMALNQGLAGSNSKEPVWSLATTLAKEVREGHMHGIRGEKVNGKLCYFPVDYRPDTKAQPDNGLRIKEVLLPSDVAGRVSDLIEIGRFSGPNEALIYLSQEGINAKLPVLDRIANELREIRQRKESARRLI